MSRPCHTRPVGSLRTRPDKARPRTAVNTLESELMTRTSFCDRQTLPLDVSDSTTDILRDITKNPAIIHATRHRITANIYWTNFTQPSHLRTTLRLKIMGTTSPSLARKISTTSTIKNSNLITVALTKFPRQDTRRHPCSGPLRILTR